MKILRPHNHPVNHGAQGTKCEDEPINALVEIDNTTMQSISGSEEAKTNRRRQNCGINSLPSMKKYHRHLEATASWLVRSVENGRGGSCSHYTPLLGWSKPYPETTGYLIPTLLSMENRVSLPNLNETAVKLGEWLLGIQLPEGAWPAGLYPTKDKPRPCVFNTGQILLGLAALCRSTGESRWLEAASRAADWLASGVTSQGCWGHNDYRSELTPSYYSHVAWPMLEVWCLNDNAALRNSALRVLNFVLSRRCEDGWFDGWSFQQGQLAFTHTIAYTLQGLLESARILNDWQTFGQPTIAALDLLSRRAELANGRLAGTYTEGWKPKKQYSCLTGNVQIASCLLVQDQFDPDLRLVNTAAKLVDYVCSCQHLHAIAAGIRGGVAGSRPIWGKYMFMRYPNWAAKYHCDALMKLIDRINLTMEDK